MKKHYIEILCRRENTVMCAHLYDMSEKELKAECRSMLHMMRRDEPFFATVDGKIVFSTEGKRINKL
jgi:hypothetical protein